MNNDPEPEQEQKPPTLFEILTTRTAILTRALHEALHMSDLLQNHINALLIENEELKKKKNA